MKKAEKSGNNIYRCPFGNLPVWDNSVVLEDQEHFVDRKYADLFNYQFIEFGLSD